MGRAFEYRKATKLKRWGHMAKTFTRLGKQIAIAVKAGGPEPENNPSLRSVIATCKRENMPKDNIERAIKNAMGKDQSEYKEVTYEGYGPHGIAIFVDTLTDNTTRTVGDVRSVFNKFSGTLGTTGSLSYLFDHKCVFTFKKKDGVDMDDLILELIDFSVEDEYDIDDEEGTITIYGDDGEQTVPLYSRAQLLPGHGHEHLYFRLPEGWAQAMAGAEEVRLFAAAGDVTGKEKSKLLFLTD